MASPKPVFHSDDAATDDNSPLNATLGELENRRCRFLAFNKIDDVGAVVRERFHRLNLLVVSNAHQELTKRFPLGRREATGVIVFQHGALLSRPDHTGLAVMDRACLRVARLGAGIVQTPLRRW